MIVQEISHPHAVTVKIVMVHSKQILTACAVINMFQGNRVPTPWRSMIKYTTLNLQEK